MSGLPTTRFSQMVREFVATPALPGTIAHHAHVGATRLTRMAVTLSEKLPAIQRALHSALWANTADERRAQLATLATQSAWHLDPSPFHVAQLAPDQTHDVGARLAFTRAALLEMSALEKRWLVRDGFSPDVGSEYAVELLTELETLQLGLAMFELDMTLANAIHPTFATIYKREASRWFKEQGGHVQGQITAEGSTAFKYVGLAGRATLEGILEGFERQLSGRMRNALHKIAAAAWDTPDDRQRCLDALTPGPQAFVPRAFASYRFIKTASTEESLAYGDTRRTARQAFCLATDRLSNALRTYVEKTLRLLAAEVSLLKELRKTHPAEWLDCTIFGDVELRSLEGAALKRWQEMIRQGTGYVPKKPYRNRRPTHIDDAAAARAASWNQPTYVFEYLERVTHGVAELINFLLREGDISLPSIATKQLWSTRLSELGLLTYWAVHTQRDLRFPEAVAAEVGEKLEHDEGHPLIAALAGLALRSTKENPAILLVGDIDGLKAHLKTYAPHLRDDEIFQIYTTLQNALGELGGVPVFSPRADTMITALSLAVANAHLHPGVIETRSVTEQMQEICALLIRRVYDEFRTSPHHDEIKVTNGDSSQSSSVDRKPQWLDPDVGDAELFAAWPSERLPSWEAFMTTLGTSFGWDFLPSLTAKADASPEDVRAFGATVWKQIDTIDHAVAVAKKSQFESGYRNRHGKRRKEAIIAMPPTRPLR